MQDTSRHPGVLTAQTHAAILPPRPPSHHHRAAIIRGSAAQQGAVLERPCRPKQNLCHTLSAQAACTCFQHTRSAHNTHRYLVHQHIDSRHTHTHISCGASADKCCVWHQDTSCSHTTTAVHAVADGSRGAFCGACTDTSSSTTNRQRRITQTRTASLAPRQDVWHINTGMFTHTCDVATAQGVVRRQACQMDRLAGG